MFVFVRCGCGLVTFCGMQIGVCVVNRADGYKQSLKHIFPLRSFSSLSLFFLTELFCVATVLREH